MKTHITLMLFIGMMVSTFTSTAQQWEKLGSRVINYNLERDVIPVGAHERSFSKLRIVVKGGAINMHRMVVEYMNGERDEIEVKHNFSKASASRLIDLRGGERKIKTIEFVYDTKNLARQKAIITIWGKH